MKRRQVLAITVAVIVLSGGLVLMTDSAKAIPLESWDDQIPSASLRFRVLPEFNNEAVLDRETQLVWERSPQSTIHPWDLFAGFPGTAVAQCFNRTTGGRKAWRLPSVHELASLIDPDVSSPGPTLPLGHPFTNVQSDVLSNGYWSATTNAHFTTNAWFVNFGNGLVRSNGKSTHYSVWCVRGGMNADQY